MLPGTFSTYMYVTTSQLKHVTVANVCGRDCLSIIKLHLLNLTLVWELAEQYESELNDVSAS